MSSCEYFLFKKPVNTDVTQELDTQILTFSRKENIYFLPKTNLPYYSEFGLFEKPLIEWVKQFCRKDQVFLDIGAHTGTYAITLAEYSQSVYAFEPQKMSYYALCGGVALSNIHNITCIPYGLGSESQIGIKTLNIVSPDGGGSTLHTNSMPVLSTEQIEIRTLDSFSFENIGFIKMDVEENELEVLKGARETLRKSNYPTILFESNEKNPPLFEYINANGYNIIPIQGQINMFLAVYKR
jgi:FkbM family methyltransferase